MKFAPCRISRIDHHLIIPLSSDIYNHRMSLSTFLGVTYVTLWSLSFYPPLIVNFKLKSSDAISIDFLLLNTLGYVTYFISLFLQLYSSTVRDLYKHYYHGLPLLSAIDLLFVAHGLILNLITLSQLYCYRVWNFKRRSLRISFPTYLFFFVFFAFQATYYILSIKDATTYNLMVYTVNLSLWKVTISFIKYLPQLYFNFKRKSMIGYPIMSIWLDLSGGIFAMLQLFYDYSLVSAKWDLLVLVNNNKGKFWLSMVTFFFDFCFIVQYYFVYPSRAVNHEEDKMMSRV